ncbi:hypothetical protein HK405_014267, partial [Cladochytrium tenue]
MSRRRQPSRPPSTAAPQPLQAMQTITGGMTDRVLTLAVIAANVAASVSIVMLSGWAFTTALVAAGRLQTPDERALPKRDRWAVGGAYAAGLVLMNKSLALNPVPIYQLLKMACIPTIAVLQTFYGVRISTRAALALALVLAGVAISTVRLQSGEGNGDAGSRTATAFGALYGAAAVVATSASQVWLHAVPGMRGLSGLQTVAVMSPYALAACAAAALAFDPDWPADLSPSLSGAVAVVVEWAVRAAAEAPVAAVVLSCLLSIFTNLLGFLLIHR